MNRVIAEGVRTILNTLVDKYLTQFPVDDDYRNKANALYGFLEWLWFEIHGDN